MVKPPLVRHSRPNREPVTIDHNAAERSTPDPRDEGVPPASPSPAGFQAPPPVESVAAPDERPDDAKEAVEHGAVAAGTDALPDGDFRDDDRDDEDGGRAEDGHRGDEAVPIREPVSEPVAPPAAFGRNPSPTTEAIDRTPSGASPRPVPPPRRGSFGLVAAGLIGGIVAILGVIALQWAGVLPSPSRGPAAAVDTAPLQAEIDALKSQVAALPAGGDAAGATAKLDALSAETETLKKDVAAIQSAVASGGAGSDAGLAALDARVKALETAPPAAPAGDSSAFETRLHDLEAKLAALGDGGAGQAASLAEKLSALEATVSTLSDKVQDQSAQPKVALTIASAALKAAVDRGQPFTTELDTYAAIAPASPEIDALRALAATGVATRAEIEAARADAANAMIDAAKSVDPDAGIIDRLWSSAEGLVKVRPVGVVEGEGVPAKVARLEAAVKAEDYARAVAEYDALPETSKAAGADFIAKVKARLAADTAIAKALAVALKPA